MLSSKSSRASLHFTLRGVGHNPASASAPFVATLVDVTGLAIYSLIARVILLQPQGGLHPACAPVRQLPAG
jgi:Mg/Co/Ni transporter MgtE